MPELPEVETTVRGLARFLEGETITRVTVNRPDMRRPFPPDLVQALTGASVVRLGRRALVKQMLGLGLSQWRAHRHIWENFGPLGFACRTLFGNPKNMKAIEAKLTSLPQARSQGAQTVHDNEGSYSRSLA